MQYKGHGLSLGVTYFEQAESIVLVKDGRGDYDTRFSRFLLQGWNGLEEKWSFQNSHPHVVGDQEEAGCWQR